MNDPIPWLAKAIEYALAHGDLVFPVPDLTRQDIERGEFFDQVEAEIS